MTPARDGWIIAPGLTHFACDECLRIWVLTVEEDQVCPMCYAYAGGA